MILADTQTSILADPSIHRFAIKTAIVAFACVASAWIVLGELGSLFDTRLVQIRADIRAEVRDVTRGSELLRRVEEYLVFATDPSNDLAPERKERLLTAVRILGHRWRPVFMELATPPAAPLAEQK